VRGLEPTGREREALRSDIDAVCAGLGDDRRCLMDILEAVQHRAGSISADTIDQIAVRIGMPRVWVAGVATFYSFFSDRPTGEVVIRLCDDIIDEFAGMPAVARRFEQELGIRIGETTANGAVTLEYAPHIGMSDQAPAALVNDVVVTDLTPEKASAIAGAMSNGADPSSLVERLGDGNNAHQLVRAMVRNNIHTAGPLLQAELTPGSAVEKVVAMGPDGVIRAVKEARLRGRGGAGFPTGMKWDFTRRAPAERRYIICDANEGEPGTFKDRVLLTERADMMIEGMTVGAYAIGARDGIIYLRAEYAYLQRYLEHLLQRRRDQELLGANILGHKGFDFDIRVQLGAGAYICGEETALINSCDGWRGDPLTRPPFPAQRGLEGVPTAVNNVETLCCVANIMEQGPQWFAALGHEDSTGTKLLSVCGDCERPGIFEVPFGIRLSEVLSMARARDPYAVQVGGASGTTVGVDGFEGRISYAGLCTGGAIMVFNHDRDIVHIIHAFMHFFENESCGYCTPCRVGNVLLRERLGVILGGRGTVADLDYLRELGENVRFASRCGLGQTSPNALLSTLERFQDDYCRRLVSVPDRVRPSFNLKAELSQAEQIAGRPSSYVDHA
jgi:[NiFe] hydrogenase diaphorase moiety large subunit